MSSSDAEEAAPSRGEGALKRRASAAAELDVPALVDAHFVSIVRGYEELYMSEHPRYADRQRRRAVWQEIGTIVNQPAEDCRKRWTRIRDNHFRAVKRAKRDAKDSVYCAKRPAHEKLMSFLNPTFKTKKELHFDKAAPESEKDDSSDADDCLAIDEHSTDVSDSSSSDEAPSSPRAAQQPPLQHDDIVDFFVELGESVKDFPEGVRIHVKREAFKIVTDAEEMLYNQKIRADLERNNSEVHE